MADNRYNIWAANPGGTAQPRLNVIAFSTSPDYVKQWNLYLQAMIDFQVHPLVSPDGYVAQDIALSYCQIAGEPDPSLLIDVCGS